MGGQEGCEVLGRTVKESGTGRSVSREGKREQNRGESKSIIRLANDLQAGTGYKGTT